MATVTDDLIRLYASCDAVALGEHVRRKDISAAEAVEAAIFVQKRSLWATWQGLWLQGVSTEMHIVADVVDGIRHLM